MRYFYLLLILFLWGCANGHQENKEEAAQLTDTTSYASKSGYLKGEKALTLVNRFAAYEDLIGTPEDKLPELFGTPVDTTFEKGAIDERDATVYYFEYPVSEMTRIYLNAAVQHGKMVGMQISSRENEELLYSSARFLLAGRGIDWTPIAGLNHGYAARSGEHLLWQINFEQTYYGRVGVVNVGTIKYSKCELAWDVENLWGTDGLGNKLDTLSSR